MAQHFLQSAQCRDVCAFDISEMTNDEAFWYFVTHRWGGTDKQICPSCGAVDSHYFRRSRKQWRCKHCDRCFSVMSGTPFDSRKMSYKKILLGLSIYVAGAKGAAATHLARQLNVQVKTALVLIGKFRECLLRNRDVRHLSGEVHIDGGHFGGKPRKSNFRKKIDHDAIARKVEGRLTGTPVKKTRSGMSQANIKRRKNRRIVMVFRDLHAGEKQGGRRTIVSVAMSENERDAVELAHRYIGADSIIMTDENAAYGGLSAWWEHHAVEHAKMFSTPEGVNENQAESYFSRLRRCEYGVVHRITPKYLMDLANEMAWREDVRRLTEGQKLADLLSKIFRNGLSRWWRGYFQGHHRAMELLVA